MPARPRRGEALAVANALRSRLHLSHSHSSQRVSPTHVSSGAGWRALGEEKGKRHPVSRRGSRFDSMVNVHLYSKPLLSNKATMPYARSGLFISFTKDLCVLIPWGPWSNMYVASSRPDSYPNSPFRATLRGYDRMTCAVEWIKQRRTESSDSMSKRICTFGPKENYILV